MKHNITINFENLTDDDKRQLFEIVKKSTRSLTLADIEDGEIFKVADIEFIKFGETDGIVTAVAKDTLFDSPFGDNNNFGASEVRAKLENDVLPKIERAVGEENVIGFVLDLLSLDGSDKWEKAFTKIGLPTFDFYRKNVKLFDKYKLDQWWWTATPNSTSEHASDNCMVCVSPSGIISHDYCNYDRGVRPFLLFVSSISVSRGD